jgi:ABC-2 type transport system permease protein
MSRAADSAHDRPATDDKGRRHNAAQRARIRAEEAADLMPVVGALDGPRVDRYVEAELVSPAPRGGMIEVLQQRYLLRLIVGRELAQLYAASILGLLWSYVQPAMRFTVYYFVFGIVLQSHRSMPNFAVHLFCGIVFVHYFSETWSAGTRSIWTNRALVLKMRVPREIFPVASMVVAAYHTGPQVFILMITCFVVGWHVSWSAAAAGALGLAILFTFSMAMAIAFAAWNVFFRDFQNIVTTITQFVHFMVPMMYGFSSVASLGQSHPVMYQLYMANPLAEAIILLQRFFWYSTLGPLQSQYTKEFPHDMWERGFIMLGVSIVLAYLAQKIFARMESQFPERL